jgi:hypothetical protein
MEATCDAQWFARVLREHHHELWIGDAAEIRAAMVRKQKTDSREALHLLDLLLTNRFPRIWVPSHHVRLNSGRVRSLKCQLREPQLSAAPVMASNLNRNRKTGISPR